ncbi:MAG: SH3 domain-containing protein [Chitinispirillaceae bacterium]
MRLKCLLTLLLLACSLSAEIKLPAKAGINGDFVKVRSNPSTKGKLVGILYKNMVVTVVERSKQKDSIGENSDYWYKVTFENMLGWTYAPFLNFNLTKDTVDTYESDLGMEWFYKRFDYSTWEFSQKIDLTSFTLEEYRALITSIMEEHNYLAQWALYYSVYESSEELEAKEDQPPFPYLKEKFYSPDFIAKLNEVQYGLLQKLPDSLLSDKEFLLKLTSKRVSLNEAISDALEKDKAFIAEALRSNYNNVYTMSEMLYNFMDDEEALIMFLDAAYISAKKNSNQYSNARRTILAYFNEQLQAKYKSYEPESGDGR